MDNKPGRSGFGSVAGVGRNERGELRPRCRALCGVPFGLCGAPCGPGRDAVGAGAGLRQSPGWRALAANLVPATTATDSCSVLSSRSLGSASSTEGHNSAAPRLGLTWRVEGRGVRGVGGRGVEGRGVEGTGVDGWGVDGWGGEEGEGQRGVAVAVGVAEADRYIQAREVRVPARLDLVKVPGRRI